MSTFNSETSFEDEVEVKEEELEYDSSSPSAGADDVSVNLESAKADDKNNLKSSSRRTRRTKRLGVKRTYGLRPRTQLRRPSYDCESEDKEPVASPRREPRGKIRGSIVAKYRRLTANARERQRMKEINDAFNTLQGILPVLQNRQQATSSPGGSSRTSMTKIRTLRHAASYIQALSDLLSGGDPDGSSSFHRELQSYSGSFQNTPLTLDSSQSQEPFSGVQQSLSKGHASRTSEMTPDSFKTSFLNTIRNHEEQQTPGGVDRGLPWEDVQTTDEELLSLLEKEVMNLRSGQLQGENANATLGDLTWNDEFVSMGCK